MDSKGNKKEGSFGHSWLPLSLAESSLAKAVIIYVYMHDIFDYGSHSFEELSPHPFLCPLFGSTNRNPYRDREAEVRAVYREATILPMDPVAYSVVAGVEAGVGYYPVVPI